MLIECIDSPIIVDKKAVLKNIRINIASKHQLRAKMIFINDKEVDIPLDIVIYNFSYPKCSLSNTGLTLNVDGEEYIRHIKFKLNVTYNFIKNIWIVDGMIDDQQLKQVVDKSSVKMMIEVIKSLIKNKI